MDRLSRLVVVLFCGGFIGGSLAIQFGYIAWPLGALIGGFVTYIVYDFERVLAVILITYDRAMIEIPATYRDIISWRPNSVYWKYWREAFVHDFNMFTNTCVALYFVAGGFYYFFGEHSIANNHFASRFFLLFVAFGCVFSLFTGWLTANDMARRAMVSGSAYEFRPGCPNVFKLYLWVVPRGVVKSGWWLIRHVPSFVMFTKKYVPIFFRLIHSESRIQFAMDTAIGAAIGYFVGSATVGGLSAVAIGVLDYELITVRMLAREGARSMFK